MQYTVVENFRAGLDRRRSILTSVPGAMYTLENVHINQGGEIEKRKAFTVKGDAFPAYTFGLEVTDAGLVTFGSQPVGAFATKTRASAGTTRTLVLDSIVTLFAVGDSVKVAGVTETNGAYNTASVVLTGVTVGASDTTITYTMATNVTEGTVADVGGTVSGLAEVGPYPTGVTYQRLRHPAAMYGGTVRQMSSAVFSTNFNGKAFVAAKFATDNRTFLYYDGALIEQSWEGIVLAGRTSLATLGLDLERALEREAEFWTVDPNSGTDGKDVVYSPSGVYSNPTESWESTLSGLLTIEWLADDFAGTAGVSSYAVFQITVATSGNITVVAQKGTTGTDTYTLANVAVTAGDPAATAAAIVAAVNTLTSETGYYAQVIAGATDCFAIFAEAALGTQMDHRTVTVSWDGTATVIASAESPNYAVTVTCPTGTATGLIIGQQVVVSTVPVVTVTGGTGPFTYAWSEQSSNSGLGIVISDTTAMQPTFAAWLYTNQTWSGYFKLVVTDSTATTRTVENIFVSFIVNLQS